MLRWEACLRWPCKQTDGVVTACFSERMFVSDRLAARGWVFRPDVHLGRSEDDTLNLPHLHKSSIRRAWKQATVCRLRLFSMAWIYCPVLKKEAAGITCELGIENRALYGPQRSRSFTSAAAEAPDGHNRCVCVCVCVCVLSSKTHFCFTVCMQCK